MSIFEFMFGLLPQLPWRGPPLPQNWGITWGSLGQTETHQESTEFSFPPLPRLPSIFSAKPASISNFEEEEIVRDNRGFIVKRIIRRKVEES